MKLYTELQVKQMIEKSRETGLTADYLILNTPPIEIPSDEEINKNGYHDKESDDIFREGVKYVIDKIQGGNK